MAVNKEKKISQFLERRSKTEEEMKEKKKQLKKKKQQQDLARDLRTKFQNKNPVKESTLL